MIQIGEMFKERNIAGKEKEVPVFQSYKCIMFSIVQIILMWKIFTNVYDLPCNMFFN